MRRTMTTSRLATVGCTLLLAASLQVTGHSQQIQSTFADLTLPGDWQTAKPFAAGPSGADIFYDSASGAVIQISQQTGMVKVGEIAKFFGGAKGPSAEAAEVMSAAEFPLPYLYTQRAAKDLAKGSKPPRMWEMKDGEGNPLWFDASQLFDDYRVHDSGGSSEVKEEYVPVRIHVAEQRPVAGGDVLLFEVETDKPANEAALKRFRMPGGFKDQHVRYGWVQFAPGGIAAGQGVLSVAYAVAANSKLTIEDVAKQVSSAKIKPL
jgi:hypothetical protein